LWHILIEADNYHALQLLEYLYPKKVDCIYIDPPYNTGAKDGNIIILCGSADV
jgi:adenine-specific DNA-methyltransferase